MDLQLLLSDDAVVVQPFDNRAIGLPGNFRIDLPLRLNYPDRPLRIIFCVTQAAIERPHDFFHFLRVLAEALIGGAVAIAREFDHVADERHFVVTFPSKHRYGGHRNNDRAYRPGTKCRHARALGADLDQQRVFLRLYAVMLEREARREIGGAAELADADSLALKL